MARYEDFYCSTCKETKRIITCGEYRSECPECETKRYNESKEGHMAALRKLSIEERIAKIEDWVYEFYNNQERRY